MIDLGKTLRACRQRSGLSLRELAARAGTSHPTVSAYESGKKQPSIETFVRVLRAAGYAVDLDVSPRCRETISSTGQPGGKGDELIEALELAAMFPARHTPTLDAPVFGRR